MKTAIPIHLIISYLVIISIILVYASFISKNPISGNILSSFKSEEISFYRADDFTNFELTTHSRKLSVSFYYDQEHDIFIKIYDVIGNLIYQETITFKGKIEKKYDVSNSRTDMLVVEVGTQKSSTTKRIILG